MNNNKYHYTPLSAPIPITEQEWPEGTLPLVNTRTMTYMHEKYIRDCIEGILMQKTTFPVQVLIHDDASTDKTADIVREYEKKYPRLIKAYYQQENSYRSKNKQKMRAPFVKWRIGKYQAICEGDDYWTDPYKLQKQVDFLEANPDYVITYHNAVVIDAKGALLSSSKLPDRFKRDFSQEDLIMNKSFVLTLTCLYRNITYEIVPESLLVINGDTFLFSILGQYGKGKYHDDIKPAVYTVHPGGIWSMQSQDYKINALIVTTFCLYNYYSRISKQSYADHYWKALTKLVVKKIDTRMLYKEIIKRIPLYRKLSSLYRLLDISKKRRI